MANEFQGVEGVIERLNGIVNPDTIESALNDAVLIVERAAKMKAPKEIAPTIKSKVEGMEGIVYTPYEIAPYIEYGTGIYSEHPMGGRKEVPWVYVEGSTHKPHKKTIYTLDSAKKMVAIMREAGLDAHYTYGREPQPYMRPALDENREEITRLLKRGLFEDD